MTPFLMQQGRSDHLLPFVQIAELGLKKIQTVELHSFPRRAASSLWFYYILEGRFEWTLQNNLHLLYPGDLAVVMPGQTVGGSRDFFDTGSICWIALTTGTTAISKAKNSDYGFCSWSSLSAAESRSIQQVLQFNSTPIVPGMKEAGRIFHSICRELQEKELGYYTRTNRLVEDLLIQVARRISKQQHYQRDFPQAFRQLEEALRNNLSHQWTVEEMAALAGLGTTAFTERVKNYSGFSPLTYLINIRIAEAIRLLKQNHINITNIALDTGFYSSQHFSTTFRKLTGYTPTQFRKNHRNHL